MVKGGPGVRLSGGTHRGRTLAVPPGARPTEGRVREALFSMWADRIDGARVLDLFAGSGAVAIEALGRGALAAVAVEDDPLALRTIRANAAKVGEAGLEVLRLTLPAGLARLAGERPAGFDLVFADPPYRFAEHEGLLAGLAPLLAAGGEATVEHAARHPWPEEAGGLLRVDSRRYGESALSFYRLG